MTEKERNTLYKCIGENMKDGVPCGFCGASMTLGSWVSTVCKERYEELMKAGPDWVTMVLYNAYGKRLEKIRKGRNTWKG